MNYLDTRRTQLSSAMQSAVEIVRLSNPLVEKTLATEWHPAYALLRQQRIQHRSFVVLSVSTQTTIRYCGKYVYPHLDQLSQC